MAKLIYVSNVSLDGYIEDEHGSFDPASVRDMKASATGDLTVGGRTPRGGRAQGRAGR
jgi:hypothetical protein